MTPVGPVGHKPIKDLATGLMLGQMTEESCATPADGNGVRRQGAR
jgi:hypothetical protein